MQKNNEKTVDKKKQLVFFKDGYEVDSETLAIFNKDQTSISKNIFI